jgi:hypothetical protein
MTPRGAEAKSGKGLSDLIRGGVNRRLQRFLGNEPFRVTGRRVA